MGNTLNGEEIEETLFSKAKAALLRFTEEHPYEICSFFAFAWMIVDGDFSICLDTFSNAQRRAREHERAAIEDRKQFLGGKHAWRCARSFLAEPRIVEYAPAVDFFAYAPYADIFLKIGRSLQAMNLLQKAEHGKRATVREVHGWFSGE